MEIGYDEDSSALIHLDGDTAACDSNAVTVDGSTVTITDEGTYLLSGTLETAWSSSTRRTPTRSRLVLDNADITSATSAAHLYPPGRQGVYHHWPGSRKHPVQRRNSWPSTTTTSTRHLLQSDLTLNGAGTLTIDSPAGHGIVSKDDLAVTSGTYEITAASHGLAGKDSVRIADGTFTIQTGKDGIHADNEEDIANGSFSIQAEGDGISSSSTLQIDDGTFSIQAGGGSANGEDHTQNDAFGGGRSGGMKPGAAGTDGAAPAEPPADSAPGAASSPEGTADTGADLSSSATAAADSTGGNTPSGGSRLPLRLKAALTAPPTPPAPLTPLKNCPAPRGSRAARRWFSPGAASRWTPRMTPFTPTAM
ncbi:MAG: carbohydrate-binding domain-containing protein [Acutalibacteraceae bacterium]